MYGLIGLDYFKKIIRIIYINITLSYTVVLIFAWVEKAKALQPGLHCDLFQVVY